MKLCSSCQRGNADDATHCQSCGQYFHSVNTSSVENATVRMQSPLPVASRTGLRRSIAVADLFARKSKLRIGRSPDCDLIFTHPLVSRHHAELARLPDGRLWLTDLGSANGTTVDGIRLVGSTVVGDGVPVGIGPFMFLLSGSTIWTIDNSKSLRLEARGLEKLVPLADGQVRKLLDNINLVIEPGEFVSVLGPSGSGKSTLMDCLNGRRRATSGLVLANGQDFYRHFDNFRQSLGYVPQKDIVHTELTVARALYYTALLRLPTDTSAKELSARMEEVISLMELEQHSDTLVANLSGGQIKRVSLGAELIARPSLLYVDEATSGLDAGTEARMMKLFRSLADQGKSLLCITHNVDNVDSCHLLVVLVRGKLVFFGPPAEARSYFRVARISEIYDRLTERELEKWEKEYAESSLHEEFVVKRLAASALNDQSGSDLSNSARPTAPLPTTEMQNASLSMPPQPSQSMAWWHQLKVLTQRYAELVLTDRRSLRLMLLQAPMIALFVLAGFVGKPFQQKIPVPRITDDEYFVLRLIQAMNQEFEATATPPGESGPKDETLKFQVYLENEKQPIPPRWLFKKLREMHDHPLSASLVDKTEIALEYTENGETKTVKRTAGQLLAMRKALQGSQIAAHLIAARETADITNPRYTYILLFLISMIVLWSGCNNAAKEIVKEEAIYGRERAVNLGIFSYLASKFIILSVFTIVQTALLMLAVYGPLHLLHAVQPSFIEHNDLPAAEYMLPYGEQFFVLCLLAMTGVALGLLLSACVSSPDRAVALLPYVLIPQIVLGGAIIPVRDGIMEWLTWPLSPEYWAFRAIRTGETTLPDILAENRMNYHDTVWLPCLVLALMSLAMLATTAWFLKRKDVQ